jgi:predicted GTPase
MRRATNLATRKSRRPREALRALLDDPDIPASVRGELGADFAQIESLLDKLKTGELHIAVFGRVSVGKSALGNALLGREAFTTGVAARHDARARRAALAGSGRTRACT